MIKELQDKLDAAKEQLKLIENEILDSNCIIEYGKVKLNEEVYYIEYGVKEYSHKDDGDIYWNVNYGAYIIGNIDKIELWHILLRSLSELLGIEDALEIINATNSKKEFIEQINNAEDEDEGWLNEYDDAIEKLYIEKYKGLEMSEKIKLYEDAFNTIINTLSEYDIYESGEYNEVYFNINQGNLKYIQSIEHRNGSERE
jgi:hypothetical protein